MNAAPRWECYFEQIGRSIEGTVYETSCGQEVTREAALPAYCEHCGGRVSLRAAAEQEVRDAPLV